MKGENKFRITLHMVTSLDGFIAKHDGDVSWMETHDNYEEGEELTEDEIADFLSLIDCYVMGSQTYLQTLELGWPYGETPVFVFTKHQFKTERDAVQFYKGDPNDFVNLMKGEGFKNIWVVGGSNLIKTFLENDLAHEIVITIVPYILGDGIPFFKNIKHERSLHLKDVKAFRNGMVELIYSINDERK